MGEAREVTGGSGGGTGAAEDGIVDVVVGAAIGKGLPEGGTANGGDGGGDGAVAAGEASLRNETRSSAGSWPHPPSSASTSSPAAVPVAREPIW
ncbi:hypothetical protein Ppa06_63320 [Planomonospora parontospora subsp. parontospora]|uniref:Uncharacterized protein n=2 Tax=Planomonospora parontospora TaxID=58119 RepID=A0AA37F922_9ACTN|nr:hypothetical protein GCM10010126_70550 [Planomonospora parontospora]GII12534.1 hypothetical protein Ppa06_63320 [Planomonospora parontospora subsp. parontospora]